MDDDLVTVRNCNWLHEAELVKSVLAVEGIEAKIPDQHTMGVQPLYGAAVGGVRVMVRASDLDRATAALDAVLDA
jgi:Putative prokaryotic signal transducing protein